MWEGMRKVLNERVRWRWENEARKGRKRNWMDERRRRRGSKDWAMNEGERLGCSFETLFPSSIQSTHKSKNESSRLNHCLTSSFIRNVFLLHHHPFSAFHPFFHFSSFFLPLTLLPFSFLSFTLFLLPPHFIHSLFFCLFNHHEWTSILVANGNLLLIHTSDTQVLSPSSSHTSSFFLTLPLTPLVLSFLLFLWPADHTNNNYSKEARKKKWSKEHSLNDQEGERDSRTFSEWSGRGERFKNILWMIRKGREIQEHSLNDQEGERDSRIFSEWSGRETFSMQKRGRQNNNMLSWR